MRRYSCTTTCFSVLRSLSDSTSKVLRSEVPITLSERPSRLVFPSVFNVPDSRKNRAVIPLSPALYHILFRMSRVSPLFLYKNYNIFFKKSEKYPKAQKDFPSRAKIFKGERRRCRDFFETYPHAKSSARRAALQLFLRRIFRQRLSRVFNTVKTLLFCGKTE